MMPKNGIIKVRQNKGSNKIPLNKKTMVISNKKAIIFACGLTTAILIIKSGIIPGINEIAVNAQKQPQVALEIKTAPGQQPEPISARYTPSTQASEAIKRLTSGQGEWLRKLIVCESSGNPGAINEKDRDGTPSYGLLQFKPATFYGFAKKYLIEATDHMNPDKQIEIAVKMIEDRKNIDWWQQFPACSEKIGFPPE